MLKLAASFSESLEQDRQPIRTSSFETPDLALVVEIATTLEIVSMIHCRYESAKRGMLPNYLQYGSPAGSNVRQIHTGP